MTLKKRMEYDRTEIVSVAGGSVFLTLVLYLAIYVM